MTLTVQRRILLLNYEFPPMGGGAGNASAQIAKALVRQGYAVDVLTSGIHGQPEHEVIEGVHIYRVPSKRKSIHDCGFRGAWSYVFSAMPVLKKLLKQNHYDALHYFFGLPTGLLSIGVPEARKIPSVISLRGSDVPGYDPYNRMLTWAHRLLKPLTRTIWKKADAVVALSQSLHDQAKLTLPSKPIEVISNAIDTDLFTPTHHQRDTTDIHLLIVARLIPRKGITDLLQAIALLKNPNIHLTIQGTGPYSETLEALAIRLGIQDQITFAGFQPRHLLPKTYQQADIFILPSYAESCGLALLEAMACGLPVIISRIGGMVEHVEHEKNGLIIPPKDPQALALAIEKLINNPELCTTLSQNNVNKIGADYTWDAVSQKYAAIYTHIIESKSPSKENAHAPS